MNKSEAPVCLNQNISIFDLEKCLNKSIETYFVGEVVGGIACKKLYCAALNFYLYMPYSCVKICTHLVSSYKDLLTVA